MDKRVLIDGKFYRPVPWLFNGECDGCAFEPRTDDCPNHTHPKYVDQCGTNGRFHGRVLVRATKEGWAEHLATRLAGAPNG